MRFQGHKFSLNNGNSELNINLSSAAEKIDPTHFEVSLKVVVQANNDNETAFIVDVTQSGIFLIDNIEEDRLPLHFGCILPEHFVSVLT
ncbi:protein-export chaperone SecB [Pseudomonas aeruginosa]|uniref:protein-export chaperone SecB n=1 Tax=Pseudomonas aeruginosa TaxID=287 RepID=UPI00333B8958